MDVYPTSIARDGFSLRYRGSRNYALFRISHAPETPNSETRHLAIDMGDEA